METSVKTVSPSPTRKPTGIPQVRTFAFTAPDIALIREDSGWTVRFYAQPNFFSQLGFKNDDFIRFDQIEKMKSKLQDPDLISRFESVIRSIER